MKALVKTLLLMAAAIGLSGPSAAMADFRDYNQKAWNQFNRPSSRSVARARSYRPSRTIARSRSYRNAPVIVRTEPAPSAVAQAPTERRSFSYEPSQQAKAATPCPPGSASTKPAPATAQRSTRSFSYEPSMGSDTGQPIVRSYSAPRMGSSRTPLYLLPKTDPRKYSAR